MSGQLRIASPAEFAARCTPLHAEALFRVASGRSMFSVASCYRCVRDEAQTVAQDLRRWCLVTGKGDNITLTPFGHKVLRQLNRPASSEPGSPR